MNGLAVVIGAVVLLMIIAIVMNKEESDYQRAARIESFIGS